jgi:hypothetical protein
VYRVASLVHTVENSVAGIQLDGGEEGFPSRGASSGQGRNAASQGQGKGTLGSTAATVNLSGGRVIGSEEGSLGPDNLRSVHHSGDSVDGGWRHQPEPVVVGHIADGVSAGLIVVAVGAGDGPGGVALLVLGGVDVGVAIGSVAQLVLGLVLGAHGAGDHWCRSHSHCGGDHSRCGMSYRCGMGYRCSGIGQGSGGISSRCCKSVSVTQVGTAGVEAVIGGSCVDGGDGSPIGIPQVMASKGRALEAAIQVGLRLSSDSRQQAGQQDLRKERKF